jgi:hypothetical protein
VSEPHPLPLRGSDHLELVTREVAELAERLRALTDAAERDEPDRLAALRARARDDAREATLFLDGSTDAMRVRVRAPSGDGDEAEPVGTWVDALEQTPGIGFDAPDEREAEEIARMRSLELAGVRAAQDAVDLAPALTASNADAAGLGGAILALHGRLTAGLVAAERVGMLRRGPRVVHDASIGRIIHFPTEPQHLADAWDGLLRSLTANASPQARTTAVARSGLLHLELLRHHPFDAANGRLARACARLMLAAEGLLDDAGLVAIEPVLAEDPLGYLDGVAASVRRADATAWVERWAEAVGEAIARAIDALTGPGTTASRAPITLADLAAREGCGSAAARVRASERVIAGELRRVVGSGGLRLLER